MSRVWRRLPRPYTVQLLGLGFGVEDSGVRGSGHWVEGSGFRVEGYGFCVGCLAWLEPKHQPEALGRPRQGTRK